MKLNLITKTLNSSRLSANTKTSEVFFSFTTGRVFHCLFMDVTLGVKMESLSAERDCGALVR